MIIRAVLVLVVLVAALTVGLRAYSKNGHSQPPRSTCTTANCNAALPGGWPADPNHLP